MKMDAEFQKRIEGLSSLQRAQLVSTALSIAGNIFPPTSPDVSKFLKHAQQIISANCLSEQNLPTAEQLRMDMAEIDELLEAANLNITDTYIGIAILTLLDAVRMLWLTPESAITAIQCAAAIVSQTVSAQLFPLGGMVTGAELGRRFNIVDATEPVRSFNEKLSIAISRIESQSGNMDSQPRI